jgi:hypothetical protein
MASDSDNSYLPTWLSETEIDPKWIEEVTGLKDVGECLVQDISNEGRRQEKIMDGATLKLAITFTGDDNNGETNKALSLVIKQVPPSGQGQSKMLGLAREGLFYKNLAPKVTAAHHKNESSEIIIPKIYHSFGDMESGSKLVVMEDLSTSSYLDSGILFGPSNPNNWNRDLPSLISKAYDSSNKTTTPPPSSYHVANDTFLAIAKVHATFWKDESLLSSSYLRCANWMQGQDKDSWEGSQGFIQGIWKTLHESGAIDTVIEWDPLVRACLTKAMAGISWDAQVSRLNTKSAHWTLVHGDFWPGNVLISTESSSDLKLLDWEMVGVGSGAQDLGQYILSSMNPTERRECERTLIENYYAELIRCGVPKEDFSFEDCWKEYKVGGIERWLWFLVYFIGQEGPLLKWAQFFHDQIQAFLSDHTIRTKDLLLSSLYRYCL